MPELLSLEQIQKIIEDIKNITSRVEDAETRLKERDKIVYDLLHPDLQDRILTEVNKDDLTDTGETSLHTHAAAAPAAHKTSHQNAGTDEIDVGGLSGELADNQPPKSHALDSHSAPAGNIAMNSKKFTGLVDPTADQDSATKKYVDDNKTLDSAVYGDGSDGDVDITSGSFSSGPITSNALTQHAYFDDLTLSGGDLDCAGYRLCVKGTLTIDSGYKVHRNGNDAVTYVAGAAHAATDLGASAVGGNGGGAGGAADPGGDIAESLGGDGGAGGTTPLGGSAGAKGDVTTTTSKLFRMIPFAVMLTNWTGTTKLTGGAGGGGGNAYVINLDTGGGGGGGGGVVLVCAKIIVNNGNILVEGGDGANGYCNGGQAGGGGGGGGGLLVIIYGSKSGSGAFGAGRGQPGTGCNTGNNGDWGVDGTVVEILN